MRIYHFAVYWPSNLVFFVTCVTYVPNLRKIGQKLWLLSWTISDRHTQTSKVIIIYLSNAMHCIGQPIRKKCGVGVLLCGIPYTLC